jgi:hypothetical protein
LLGASCDNAYPTEILHQGQVVPLRSVGDLAMQAIASVAWLARVVDAAPVVARAIECWLLVSTLVAEETVNLLISVLEV